MLICLFACKGAEFLKEKDRIELCVWVIVSKKKKKVHVRQKRNTKLP